MKKECEICNSIIWEVTLFNGETRNFCSLNCLNMGDIIEDFRNFVQSVISRYEYVHEDTLIDFIYPKTKKYFIKSLINEVVNRNYFDRDKFGFIYNVGAIIKLPRAV